MHQPIEQSVTTLNIHEILCFDDLFQITNISINNHSVVVLTTSNYINSSLFLLFWDNLFHLISFSTLCRRLLFWFLRCLLFSFCIVLVFFSFCGLLFILQISVIYRQKLFKQHSWWKLSECWSKEEEIKERYNVRFFEDRYFWKSDLSVKNIRDWQWIFVNNHADNFSKKWVFYIEYLKNSFSLISLFLFSLIVRIIDSILK